MHTNTSIYLENLETSKLGEIIQVWESQYRDGGILALVAEKNVDDVKTLQAIANSVSYPLVGAVFPELITNSEFKGQGILLFLFEDMPANCLVSIDNNAQDLEQVCHQISNCGDINLEDNEQALLMFFDAMVPKISSIIDSLYLEMGDVVNYMGVNAGSETFQPIDCLFNNNQFIGNAVLTLLINNHSGAIVEHGYTKPDTTILATSTSGNRISSIDWCPAFDVYKELARSHYDVNINKENFYENAVHFPFGIMRMDGEMLVRIPVAMEEDGSIYCVGEVPENSVLTLLKAIPPGSPATVEVINSLLSSTTEENILTFYCAGRRMHLGDAALSEIGLLSEKLHNKNIIGALSLGEIGGSKQGGYPLFHNAALVNIPWK